MTDDITILLEGSNSIIQREYDDESFPLVNGEQIRFNGKGEDGHETFLLAREDKPREWSEKKDEVFNFCKTAHKDYDVYVTAVLVLAKLHLKDNIRLSSDGDISDWQAGIALINSKLGKKIVMRKNESAKYPSSVSDAIIKEEKKEVKGLSKLPELNELPAQA
jgi:hypothetical protein